MPRKPKRPCSYPGCPKLTDGRFCEEHQKLENQRYEKYDRDPAAKRRYGRAWKRIRDRYMNAHPLCERCQRDGRLVKAEQVHHIKPLAEGGDHSENNLMSLCSSCHAENPCRTWGPLGTITKAPGAVKISTATWPRGNGRGVSRAKKGEIKKGN